MRWVYFPALATKYTIVSFKIKDHRPSVTRLKRDINYSPLILFPKNCMAKTENKWLTKPGLKITK